MEDSSGASGHTGPAASQLVQKQLFGDGNPYAIELLYRQCKERQVILTIPNDASTALFMNEITRRGVKPGDDLATRLVLAQNALLAIMRRFDTLQISRRDYKMSMTPNFRGMDELWVLR